MIFCWIANAFCVETVKFTWHDFFWYLIGEIFVGYKLFHLAITSKTSTTSSSHLINKKFLLYKHATCIPFSRSFNAEYTRCVCRAPTVKIHHLWPTRENTIESKLFSIAAQISSSPLSGIITTIAICCWMHKKWRICYKFLSYFLFPKMWLIRLRNKI